MSFEMECAHLGCDDFLSVWVVAGLEDGVHCQAAQRRGAANEGEQRVLRSQRYAGPVAADLTEEPVFDGVPLRATSGIVAHGHRQPETIADLHLQPFIPGADLKPIAAPASASSRRWSALG